MVWVRIAVAWITFSLALFVLGGVAMAPEAQLRRTAWIHQPADGVFDEVVNLQAVRRWWPWPASGDANWVVDQQGVGAGALASWRLDDDTSGEIRVEGALAGRRVKLVEATGALGQHEHWFFLDAMDDGTTWVTWGLRARYDVPVIGPYLAWWRARSLGAQMEEGLRDMVADLHGHGVAAR